MSTTATVTQSPAKSKKEKEKDRREKAAQQQTTERLKTVVRRLPPNLPEEIFWQTVQRWVTDDTTTWKIYYGGKFKKRLNKENIPSRAYIAFKNEELLMQFSREFDGHLFKDKAGNESYAIVEYAPHQKVPSEKRKQDSKNNTIEKDEDYISFVESLKAPTTEPVTIESLIASTRPPSPPKTTPLLEALKAEKSAQKDKEAILRNHAHYKDQATIVAITTNPNRKDEKKKVSAPAPPTTNQPAKGGETAAPTSKKAKKAAAREAKEAAQAQKAAAAKAAPEPKQPAAHTVAGGTTKQSRQHQKQAKHAAPPAPTPVILAAKPPPQPAPAAAPAVASSSAAPSQADAPAPQRRARAVLGRHLEVALAGVGASARARKEKEKERAKETAATVDVASTKAESSQAASSAATAGGKEAKDAQPSSSAQSPPSPQRHRNRRGGPPAGPPNVKTPAVAQRSDSIGGAPANALAAQPGVIVPPAGLGGAPSERGRGGRPRGRGRGGRGGPPARGG